MAKKQIAGEITSADFTDIETRLGQILVDQKAGEVHLRLNESGNSDLAPIFVGWVEDQTSRNVRLGKNKPDPGLYRFGDRVLSSIYVNAYDSAKSKGPAQFTLEGRTIEKDWNKDLPEKKPDELALVSKSGLRYQLAIALIVGGHFVGTLNMSANESRLQAFTKNTEITSGSIFDLVKWLDQNFNLSGPPV